MTPDRREQLYDNLINSGKLSEAEIGTKEQFRNAVKDEETARKFYNNLKNSGLFDESEIGTEDQFYEAISPDFAVSDEFAPYPEEVRDKFFSKENQRRRGNGPKKSIEELYDEYDKEGYTKEQVANLRKGIEAGASVGGSIGETLANAREAGEEAKQEVQAEQPEPQPVKTPEEKTSTPLQRDPAAELSLLRTAGKYAAPVGQTKEIGGKALGGSTAMGQAMKNIEDRTRAQEQEQEVQDILEGRNGITPTDEDIQNIESGNAGATHGKGFEKKDFLGTGEQSLSAKMERYNDVQSGRFGDEQEKMLHDAYEERERLRQRIESQRTEDTRHYGGASGYFSEARVAGWGGTELDAAYRQVQDRINTLEAARDGGGFWRGFANAITDPDLVTFGGSELGDAARMLEAKESLENGELSKEQNALLNNMILTNQAQEKYGNDLGFLYTAGNISANALPFMAEFFLTGGGFGVGSAIEKGVIKAVSKATAKGMKKHILKALGSTAADIAAAGVMTNTTGAARTYADIVNRYIGTPTKDDKGNIIFEGGKNLGQAIYEGEVANFLEYYTEMLGNRMEGPVMKWLADNGGLSKITNLYSNLTSSSKLGKTIGTVLKAGGINSLPNEGLEEEANIILNSLLVGDNQFSDLWDGKTQRDIWGGMLFSVGSMSAMQVLGDKIGTYVEHKRLSGLADAASAKAGASIGEEWNAMKGKMDGTDNEHFADLAGEITDNKNLSTQQKRDALEYMGSLARLRGFNTMTVINAREEANQFVDRLDPMATALKQGHDKGAQALLARDGDPHSIQVGVNAAAANLDAAGGQQARQLIDANIEGSPEDLTKIVMSLPDNMREPAMAYIEARSSLYGIQDVANEDIQQMVWNEQERVQPNVVESVDEEGNARKTFTTVNYGGQTVYVRNYDPTSPYIHIVDDKTGEVKQIIRGQDDALDESSIQTYDYDQYMRDFERNTETSIGAELEERMAHNAKTDIQMAQGSMIGSADGQMYVFANDGQTVQLLPTKANAETGQLEPISGQPTEMSVADAIAMQDGYYDTKDYPVAEAVEEKDTQKDTQEGNEDTQPQLSEAEAAVNTAGQALIDAGLGNEKDLLDEGGTIDTTAYDDEQLALMQQYTDAVNAYNSAKNAQQETTNEAPRQETAAQSKIPVDKNGNKLYEQAPAGDTYDDIVASVGEEEDAMTIINGQIVQAQAELDRLQKQKKDGKLKGNTVQEQIDAMKALNEAIKAAQDRINYWTGVSGVPQARANAGVTEEVAPAQPQQPVEPELPLQPEAETSPETAVQQLFDDGAKFDDIRAAINAMPEGQREVAQAYFDAYKDEVLNARRVASVNAARQNTIVEKFKAITNSENASDRQKIAGALFSRSFIWDTIEEAGVRMRGINAELFGGGERPADKEKYRNWIKSREKGGSTIDGVAHTIWEGVFGTDSNVTTEQVKNEIIDLLREFPAPIEMAESIVTEEEARIEAEQQAEKDAYAQEFGFSSWQDMETYNELGAEEVNYIPNDAEDSEIFSIFAEENENLNENEGTDTGTETGTDTESGSVGESEQQSTDGEGGTGVLSGTQSDNERTSEQGEQGGANETGEQGSDVPGNGEGALSEREQYIASHPLTEAEIDASDAPNARKNSAKRYLNGTDESPLAKAAYLSIYNKKPKITATEPETAGTTDESNAAADAAKAKLQTILARLNQHKKKPNKDGVNEYSVETLTPEQVDDMLELVEAGAEYGYQILDAVSSKKGWKEQISDVIKEPLQNATGYTDQEVDELIEDIWNSPYENEWGDTNTIKEYAEEKGIDINDNENGNEEGNGNAGVQAGESGSDTMAGTTEGSTEVSDTDKGSPESAGETGEGTVVSGGNSGSSEGRESEGAGRSGSSSGTRGTSGTSTGSSNTGRSNGGKRTNDGASTGRGGKSDTLSRGGTSVGRGSVAAANDTQSSQEKLDAITKEKVPYRPASAGEKHAIGSVVPSGIVDAVSSAFKRLKESLGKKSVLDFVREELGYKTSEEMLSDFNSGKTDGLASEQVDAVALAIQAMKNGRSFIVGDMTGVGKGRTAAALIRWGLQHKKKVLFITEKSGLFSDMHRDLTDIGCNYLPFVTNSDVDANITDADGNKVVPKPSKEAQNALWQREDDKLPRDKKGRQYDFVMTTYSQASNPRGEAAKAKLEWLKNYAKDAIVIMDESHNASGESNRGNFFRDIVEEAGGVTFLSATYAKRPDNMILYALKSSMKELNISVRDMLDAIKEYGVAMQELMASSLFGSGEMIRRERDMSDVKTTWEDPKKVYSEQEYEECRKTSDKTMQVVNDIIDFQREFVNPIVREHEREYESQNAAAALAGAPQTHATNTSYKSQVSNILGLIVYSMKAKKAAEMAIEQIKAGKKPVIAVENTLGSYVDELDDAIEKADFAPIFAKGIRFALRYSIAQYKRESGEYKKDKDSERIFDATSELSEDGQTALRILEAKVKAYLADQEKIDLTLSPIDLIKKMIADAGYNCGEITGRSYQLVQQPDGTYTKEPLRTKKKEVARKFNGGSKASPIDEKNQYQALVLNVAGATGISLHSSKTFGNQQPRTMIILQPARDVNTEVQMRGRIDRTGQVHRGEYFYLTSPIPAEQKLTMMLKQKLASLDAQSVGTKEVSSNRVDSQDMDNKYGDEVCYQFLLEHLQDINAFLDNGLKWNNKTKEWEGHPGLLYDVLKDLQRMGCDIQEKVINELSQRYADQIDYLNQNGINDLETAAMNLEAVTIDKAVFINGKDNGSPSEFAHDTNIERVEVNVLKKPMRSSDITKKMKDLGSLDEEGLPKEGMMGEMEEKVDAEIQELINKREQKNKEKEEKHEALIRSSHPKKADQTDEEYENMIQNWPTLLEMRNNHDADLSRYTGELAEQKSIVMRAAMYLKPGQPCLVPLTDDVSSGSASMYGRFLGFQSKNGDPRQIKALFAVKDSRSMISVPIVNQNKVIDKIISDSRWDTELTSLSQNDYGEALPAEEKAKSWNEWWDRMIPKNTNRQIRYMITGNVVQACGSLGKYKGQIVTFTRKNPETGEITLERGMLLAENFDPENFRIRRPVEKKDIWDSYNGVDDELTKIYCYRSGDRMYIRFNRQKGQKLVNHPALKDDALKEIATSDGVYNYGRDALQCEVTEENVEKMLKHLLSEYGYAKEELFVMPDSTEKPDAIVRTNRPYQEIIDEYSPKYGDYLSVVQGYISKAVKRYKMDVNNDILKEDIRKAVQLRQALLRKKFAETSTNRLAWKVLVYDQEIEAAKDDKYWREKYMQEREAALEELEYRGSKGNQLHLEQGKMSTEGLTDLFNSLNDESTEEGQAKKVLFDKIMNKVRQLPSMEIILNDKIDNGTGGMAAGRMIEYNWKYMNADYISDQAKADTILHELIHTVTSYAALCVERGDEHLLTSEMVDAINELQNIYDVIKKDPRFKHDGVDAYGFKNLHEMLAEAGSNSQFREDLKNTGLWAKIKSGILRFFGIVENVMNGKKVIAFDEIMDRLDFLIENFSKEAWEETYRGTVYGSYGQQLQEEPNTEDQDEDPFTKAKRMVNERWAKMATPYIENWSEKLGVPIRAITDIRQIPDNLSYYKDAIEGKDGVRAWYVTYEDGSDEVYIYLPNTSSYKELDGLIMHEVVAHKGLKGLLGEEGYKNLCLKVYDEMTPEEQEKWRNYESTKNIKDEEERNASAGDEYIANLAETIRPGNSTWDRIISLVRGMLRKMGLDIKISDAELSELIRESYNNLTNPDPNGGGKKLGDDLSGKNGIGALLEAVDKRNREVTAYREATSTPQGTQSVVTSGDWDREASDASNQLRTIAVDMYTPLLRLQQLLEKKLGIKITDSKNAHQAMLNLASVNLSEMGIYDRMIGKRLSDAAIALMGKKAFKKNGIGMDELNDYMYAKHAVERNRQKAIEDFAASEENSNPNLMEQWNLDKEAVLGNSSLSWREQQEMLDNLLEGYGIDFHKTPSMGLADMFEMEEKDDWRSEAYDYVEAFERTKDPDALQEYWDAVHAATDYILDKGTASGLYEKGYKERQHRRWQYYVPLRGFDEVIAQDVYAYADEASKQSNNSLKAVMRGRKSKAGNIFGGIVALGYGSIIKGNENLAKQRFMNLAREAQKGGSSLMKVNETWAVQYGELANYPNLFKIPTDGTYADDEYVQAVPNINDDMTPEEAQELLAAFYDKLEELEADDKSVKLHGKGRIPYRTLFDQDKQHQVTVYENGRRYTVTMLGDNAAAQAINNMLNPGRNKSQAVNVAKKVNRFMSANFTSRNPAFAVSNVIRDSQFSANNVWVKENLRYFGKFLKNLAENYATVLPMFVKYQASGNALGSSKTGRMFKEFMDHGGPIGYTFTESQQDYAEKFAKATREQTKQIEKIKDLLDPAKLINPKRALKNVLEAVEEFAEASELINRFAAYKTSREMGRSISRSILDAHEVSINFAQKGAGTSWQSRGQGAKKAGMDAAAMLTSYGQNFIVFYNANIQGRYIAFDNFFGNLGRGDKGKTAKALFSQVVVPGVAGGFGIALLNDVILPAMYEALGLDGDDDDDKYYDMLNDYVRQNKICLRLPGHRWATIPLDPEAVPMWTIGDILYNMCNGKDVNSDDIMRSMVDAMSPATVQWERKGNQWVSFIPSLIQPVADLVANQNFLGYSIYKEDPYHKQGGVPKFKMVYSNTSESLVKLSELSNMLGGGNDVEAAGYNPDSDESNAFDWNPATVQHILKGFVGGIPETILGIVDASMSMLTGGSFDTGTQKIPLISRFYVGGDPELEDKRIDTAFEQVKYGYERGEGVIKRYDKEIEKAEKENNPIRKAEYRAAADKTEDKEIYRKYGQLAESGVMKKIKTLEEKDIPKAEQSGASADEINDMKNTLSMLKQSVVSYMKTIGENYEMPDVK